MNQTTERRATPRSMTAIRVENRSGGPTMVAHDISLGGMMVTSAAPIWPGTFVRVRFKLPGEERAIQATCQVVDLIEVERGVGFTLRFLKLALSAKMAIMRFVDRRPLPENEDGSLSGEVASWVSRIIEDCSQLKVFSEE